MPALPEPPTALRFLYGTAWKEDRTRDCVRRALAAGFRGIDTANQRRHYHEAAVGEGLADAIAAGIVTRDDVFVQTKFTYASSQDHRLPYAAAADVATQVRQSFESSLEHLRVTRLDALVLHGPATRVGIGATDLAAWRALETIHASGGARALGVSNVSIDQLEALCARVAVAPAFVQNRCYASTGWDRAVRAACRARGIVYQGFSLLTANRTVLASEELVRVAKRLRRTPAQVVFRFAQQVGMLPLTGTTDDRHMREDLACDEFDLEAADVERIERIAERGG